MTTGARTRLLALVGLTFATIAMAQPTTRKASAMIVGTVADTSLRPIAGADVNFAGSNVRITTDSLGRFRFVNVPMGKFILIVRNIGFRPATNEIDVAPNDTLRLAFELEPSVRELSTIMVTERRLSPRLRDFDERRKLGFGEFFTVDQIEKAQALTFSDLLRLTKGVRVLPDSQGRDQAFSSRDYCPMSLYLDNIPLGPVELTYLPTPKQIVAMEVYAGAATIPLWLPRGPGEVLPGCGAILVWTRDGS